MSNQAIAESRDSHAKLFRENLTCYIRSQAKPPDKFSHQARLYRLAVDLAGEEPFDDDVLFAAAWLHDLGVFVGHRPEDVQQLANWDHVAYVFHRGPGILRQLGFPAEKIEQVLEVVRTHQPMDTPTCREGVLLRDADILEQLGAVGILRVVSKVGRDTRFVTFADALRVLKSNLERLPPLLKLERSRLLAAPRIAALTDFLKAAEQEAGGIEW